MATISSIMTTALDLTKNTGIKQVNHPIMVVLLLLVLAEKHSSFHIIFSKKAPFFFLETGAYQQSEPLSMGCY